MPIYLEATGGGCDDNGSFTSFNVYESSEKHDGSGYKYNKDGSRYSFWWACPRDGKKVDKRIAPDDFIYSFYHGLDSIDVYIEDDELLDSMTAFDIIAMSDYKDRCVSKESVDAFNYLSSAIVKSPSDIKNLEGKINASIAIPNKLVDQIMSMFDIEHATVSNGEIGIAALHDSMNIELLLKFIFCGIINDDNYLDKLKEVAK